MVFTAKVQVFLATLMTVVIISSMKVIDIIFVIQNVDDKYLTTCVYYNGCDTTLSLPDYIQANGKLLINEIENEYEWGQPGWDETVAYNNQLCNKISLKYWTSIVFGEQGHCKNAIKKAVVIENYPYLESFTIQTQPLYVWTLMDIPSLVFKGK